MRRWYPAVAPLLALGASLLVWERLPDRMPVHWSLAGEVDGHASRGAGAFGLPLLMVAVALLLPLLARLDPRRAHHPRFQATYRFIADVVLTFLLAVHGLVLATALGATPPMQRLVPLGIGALLVLLGNVLPRTRSNWLVGIRTPWTLSSDRVWQRTHRVGGFMLVGAGLTIVLTTLSASPGVAATVTAVALLAATAGAVGYSYAAWRQER